ncbi:hypothetical protein ACIRJO_02755 [Streptomyces sp. NPDC102394]|uniref:hypothetical protein n=1 Tax=Streptomyces sp. NPDC102394 TaxID=3366167 RepID=UPI00380A95CA
MDADKRVITVDRHEWTLKQPAHHTEVEKTIAVAERERGQLATRGVRTGDVHVAGDGEQLLVSFEAERPRNPKRPGFRGVATSEAVAADD